MSQTNARRRALVLVLGLLASFAVLWITASVGDRAQAQQNTPATGTVTITGTVGIGELLTAHVSGITDADGLTNPNFLFLWLAGPTSDPTEATVRVYSHGERYHVLPFDAGLRIMVAVAFYDDAGNLEAIHSAATAVVATVAPAPHATSPPPRLLRASSACAGRVPPGRSRTGSTSAPTSAMAGRTSPGTRSSGSARPGAGPFPRTSPKKR